MKTKIFLILPFIIIIASCKKETATEEEMTLSKRDIAVMDYNENYLGSELEDPEWTGDTATCIAGTVPQSTHDKVINRINYFRRMVGLNDNTTLDASQFEKYQETALMMTANVKLDHYPDITWDCWSEEGANGAATSNLAYNHATDAVTIFMEDPGGGNYNVGHRRWILYSTSTQFSYGTTDKAMALGVIGVARGNTQIPSYIAYPPNGYIPQQLVFPRWSFSIPGADFSSADVTMNGPNGNIDLDVVSVPANNIGDNTIVWEPVEIDDTSLEDVSYTVTVSGVKNASQTSYNYTVDIINP